MTTSRAAPESGDPQPGESARYRVVGMDCADDAAEIEQAARTVPGIETVRVSTATQIMTVRAAARDVLREAEQAVERIGYRLEPLNASRAADEGRAVQATRRRGDDGDEPQKHTRHITPAYKRALWVVVVLNVGYGIIEIVGGFLSGSQALKADALDFIGDGLITFLGLLAIGWSLAWRARSALVQGLFLGALGLGVVATTAYRVVVQQQPEAELMGAFALVALMVNVAAAAVLLPHRTGDANVRAVWLFSRNDAIGNLAVVIAAGLVAWTGTPWPDLIVAVVIAGLFLQSSWHIVRDARTDLREAGAGM